MYIYVYVCVFIVSSCRFNDRIGILIIAYNGRKVSIENTSFITERVAIAGFKKSEGETLK